MKVLSKVLGVILARLVLLLVGCWLLVRVFCPSSGINVPRRYLSHLPQDLLGAEKSFAPSEESLRAQVPVPHSCERFQFSCES
jgi:hypothetical protein